MKERRARWFGGVCYALIAIAAIAMPVLSQAALATGSFAGTATFRSYTVSLSLQTKAQGGAASAQVSLGTPINASGQLTGNSANCQMAGSLSNGSSISMQGRCEGGEFSGNINLGNQEGSFSLTGTPTFSQSPATAAPGTGTRRVAAHAKTLGTKKTAGHGSPRGRTVALASHKNSATSSSHAGAAAGTAANTTTHGRGRDTGSRARGGSTPTPLATPTSG